MRIVTVARKPLSEGNVASNVLKHGTGAIHIDEVRIHTEATDQVANHGRRPTVNGWDPRMSGIQAYGQTEGQKLGRWPANLVLQHLPGCTLAGTTTVASNGHFPASRGRGSDVTMAGQFNGQEGLVERHTKGEVVAQWECEPGCPVAELDRQSGIIKAGTFSGSSQKGMGYHGAASEAVGLPSRKTGDSGGASRFFKQVK